MYNIWENFDFGGCPPNDDEKINVMDNIDWDKINKEYEENKKKMRKRFSWFIDIIKEEVKDIVGDIPELEVEAETKEDGGWWISKVKILINRSNIFDVFLDGNDFIILETPLSNHDSIYGKPMKIFTFDPKLIFRDYIRQMITNQMIPMLKEFYKQNYIKDLPSKLIENKKINFSKLTTTWLIDKFHEISENEMNGETIENVTIEKTKKGLFITFDLDCDRMGFWKNKSIEINNRGNIVVNLEDTPVEGSGIESELKKSIEKIIKG